MNRYWMPLAASFTCKKHMPPKTPPTLQSEKTPALKEQIYRFTVSLNANVERDIEVAGKESLYNLAGYIVNAFGFDFDHAFGFFSNLKGKIYDSAERYELFTDEGQATDKDTKGVEKEYIYKVFSEKKKMLFLFDYEEDWRFILTCTQIYPKNSKHEYPRLAAKRGRTPKQYSF